jgi:thiamine kinase-like enzyme
VTSAGLTLIDFDTSSLRDPASDIGKFLADLLWWHVCYGKSRVELAQEHFIQGYLSGASTIPEERLIRARLYEAVILAKMTLRRVPIFDLCWADRTADLIHRAEGVVGSLKPVAAISFVVI